MLSKVPVTSALFAVVGGFLGSVLHDCLSTAAPAQQPLSRTLKVTALELVDNAGHRVGLLGTDKDGNVGLTFFDYRGRKRTQLGLGVGLLPFLHINGPEEDSLLSLELGHAGHPRLIMSDHDYTGRVFLGTAEPDSPSPEWKYNTWVLRFGGRSEALAAVGMTTGKQGGVVVRDLAGGEWRTPLK